MAEKIFDLIVVGGGAAGFFGAIVAAERKPGLRILILEKSRKILSKVKVSGGGRCNVTHNCPNPFRLADHYPRGEKGLKQLFKAFDARDMVTWLQNHGVELKVEDDGRMFPVTDDSQTIIDCFLQTTTRLGIGIQLDASVLSIVSKDGIFQVDCSNGSYRARKVLVAAGGSPKAESYHFLEACGHRIESPIPSLFTFNDSVKAFADLMGVSVSSGEVRITGTKFTQRGAILITHWGLSGPAVIKLSAWAAAYLHDLKYQFTVHVNWTAIEKESDVREQLLATKRDRPKQRVRKFCPFALPSRLWERLCQLSDVEDEKIWGEISGRNLNKLLENTFRCVFEIRGKTTFKEEFVTCGGVDLREVDIETMESKIVPGLYFAGEVLNIDGETGGFNFQAAWTTAFVAGVALAGSTPDETNKS